MRVIILTPVENCKTRSIKVHFIPKTGYFCLQNLLSKLGDAGNDQLATLRYDFKRLTSRPNILEFYSIKVHLLHFNVFLNDLFFFTYQGVIDNYADNNTLSFIHANTYV